MAFTDLQKKTTNTAQAVNDNFYHVYEGDFLPRGGFSLATTDLAYDLGELQNTWSDVHSNKITWSTMTTDGYLWREISNTELAVTATSIEVTLNGDAYSEIMLLFHFVLYDNSPLAGIGLQISLNGVVGYNKLCSVESTGTYVSNLDVSIADISPNSDNLYSTGFVRANLNLNSALKHKSYSGHSITLNTALTSGPFTVFAGQDGDTITTEGITITTLELGYTDHIYPGTKLVLWGRV